LLFSPWSSRYDNQWRAKCSDLPKALLRLGFLTTLGQKIFKSLGFMSETIALAAMAVSIFLIWWSVKMTDEIDSALRELRELKATLACKHLDELKSQLYGEVSRSALYTH